VQSDDAQGFHEPVLALVPREHAVLMEDLIKVTISGHMAKELNALRPVLDAWVEAVLRYCRFQGFEDTPWYYNERANISVLAGAAWSLDNWAALEEFSTKKRGREEDQKDRNGRCDLYLCTRAHHYAFEAKLAWQSIGGDNDRNIVQRELKRAWKDAGELDIEQGDSRIAATFVVPHLTKARAKLPASEVRQIVENWIKSRPFDFPDRRKSPKPDALAYVFPGRFKDFVGAKNGYLFPGVVLALYVRKAARKGVQKTPRPEKGSVHGKT
jgi:hypothetical protein